MGTTTLTLERTTNRRLPIKTSELIEMLVAMTEEGTLDPEVVIHTGALDTYESPISFAYGIKDPIKGWVTVIQADSTRCKRLAY